MDLSACWSCVGEVDASPVIAWLEAGRHWSAPPNPTKPQRIFDLPAFPLVAAVLAHFPATIPHGGMLSRMRPGQSHPTHVDAQRPDWITRVHVPLRTNTRAWIQFEEEGERVHFEVGRAYTFDALRRHAFGNDGDEDRVHLIFDVLRADP